MKFNKLVIVDVLGRKTTRWAVGVNTKNLLGWKYHSNSRKKKTQKR